MTERTLRDFLRNRCCSALLAGWVACLHIAAAAAGEGSPVRQLFRSVDQGVTWVRSEAGLPAGGVIHALGGLAGVLLAGVDDAVFVSRDGAKTWRAASVVAKGAGRITCFSHGAGVLFAGTVNGGVLRSVDGGEHWASHGEDGPRQVRSLVWVRGVLYAGTDADGVAELGDAGGSWRWVSRGLPERSQVFELGAVGDTPFAALYGNGLFRWDRDKRLWTRMGNVEPLVLASTATTLVIGHNPGGLHWSDTLGVRWEQGNGRLETGGDGLGSVEEALPLYAPVWAMASGGGRVLAGAAGGVFLSEDRGRTWVPMTGGLPKPGPGVALWAGEDLMLAAVLPAGSGKARPVP